MKWWAWVLVGLVLILAGCHNGLGALRSSWNVANASAVETLDKIERLHKADTDAIVENPNLTKTQKLEALEHVRTKWEPIYEAWRAFRAALLVARAALITAETREAAGLEPNLDHLAELVAAVLVAKKATLEAIP